MNEAIKERLREKGWSQAELAHRVNMNPGSLSHITRGTRNPSVKTMKRIASALGASVPEIFFPEEEVSGDAM